MIIRNITLSQFSAIVEKVGAEYNGNLIIHPDMRQEGKRVIRVQGRIRTESSREAGARRSWSGRRTVSACWHAHRDVYREVFAQYPNATVQTSMARYTADNFEDVYPDTGNNNIGSMFAPAYMPDLCEC
jgi:hypothetical protein